MTAAAKGSVSAPMLITKDEATAAQRTVLFHLCKTADQADCTGVVPVVTLSKAGAAFGAAVGPVTELANGWYKIVLDAADVDTLGQLAMRVAVATADTLDVVHQVVAFDLNTATVALTAASITTASFAAGAINAAAVASDAIGSAELAASAVTEIQTGLATAAAVAAIQLATRTVVKQMGTMEVDGSENTDEELVAVSTKDALSTTWDVSGTWNGATVTAYTTQDPTASPVVWTATGTPLTNDGQIAIAGGGHVASKLTVSDDGASTELNVSVAIVKPANT